MNTEWTADQVWAAAAKACRINQWEYLRNDEWLPDPNDPAEAIPGRLCNSSLMFRTLRDPAVLQDEDFEDGRAARKHFEKAYVFKGLRHEFSGFERRLLQSLTKESFTESDGVDFRVIASQIPRWYKDQVEMTILADINTEPLGTVGERLSREVIIAGVIWSEKYQIHFITGRTSCSRKVLFGYKEKLELGKKFSITGTVKQHRSDCTQLNRVKLFDL